MTGSNLNTSFRNLSNKNDDDNSDKVPLRNDSYKGSSGRKKKLVKIKAKVIFPNLAGASIVIPQTIDKNMEKCNKNPMKILSDIPIIQIAYPLFPTFTKKIEVQSISLNDAIKKKMEKNLPYVAVFLSKNRKNGIVQSLDEIYSVGRVAHIDQMISHGNIVQYVLTPYKRIKLLPRIENSSVSESKEIQTEADPVPSVPKDIIVASCELFEYTSKDITPYVTALSQEIVKSIKELAEHAMTNIMASELYELEKAHPMDLADIAPHFCTSPSSKLQQILESDKLEHRLSLLLECLKESLEVIKIRNRIQKKIEDNIANSAKEYFLKEYLNEFQNMVNQSKTPKKNIQEKFNSRLKDLILPDHVLSAYEEELERMSSLDPSSLEYSLLVNYLDLLTTLPWGKFTTDSLDLVEARKILDQDHHGIKDVKDRIIEFIAVAIQSKSINGKIICLVGPPGVGKTSVAKSIARSLNREYLRFSVGGIDDICEIKGHRRTYVGAMPGKILQCLKRAKSMNPVILVDEIDKISRSFRGDPSAALLECMDPEQNVQFLDHYLDLPIDLSKVLFICTANDTSTITPPLLDRMELIEISGYINEEKKVIAEQFSIPKIMKEVGLNPDDVVLTRSAVKKLVEEYSREPGIRNLVKMLNRIFRKAIVKLHTDNDCKITVDVDDVRGYLGSPSIPPGMVFQNELPCGVATGLAYTGLGGEILYIETAATKVSSKEVVTKNDSSAEGNYVPLQLTGRLGDVMKESCVISHLIAKEFVKQVDYKNDFLDTHRIHCHFPEGATPKDGPSAGIAIVSSLISLALKKPIERDLAMTGEICLSHMVLPVGGLKEKLTAALRGKISTVIVPEANKHQIEDLPIEITSLLKIHYVKSYADVARILFPDFASLITDSNPENRFHSLSSDSAQNQSTCSSTSVNE